MSLWFNHNLDIVFFIYGLAFVSMGISIAIQPKEGSEFRLGSILWLLAGFGIIHGLNEWLDMWAIIKGRGRMFDIIRWLCLVISYWFIFELGRRLLRIHTGGIQGWRRSVSRYFVWHLSPVIGLVIFIAAIMSHDFWKTGTILTRYMFGFPGALLTGICLLPYYRREREKLDLLNVRNNFIGLSISFIAYGLLGGLIVPMGDFFPANVLNTGIFFSTMGVPVQTFRAVIAIYAAYNTVRILRIFNYEMTSKLHSAIEELNSARKQLELKVRERTEELHNSNELLAEQVRFIAHMAYHDNLTGLPNKRMLTDRFDQVVPRMKRKKLRAAVLFIDLNRFKLINDTLGHSIGDEALKEVASRLTRCVRGSDTVARLGGDEFIMLFPEISRIEDASKLVERIFEVLGPPIKLKEHEFTITASIGISIFPDDGDRLEILLSRADAAMYRAKEEKQNSYQFYTMNMSVSSVERLQMEERLRRAFDNHEFLLHYQPQIDIDTGEIVGIEALVRWNNPKMGLIPPGEFIPLAEETGLIIPLGKWIMESACRQNKLWQEQGLNPVIMAVNVSRLQFKQRDFVNTIKSIIYETGLDPNLLEIEITESIIMNDFDATIKLLNEIRDIGVRIAIDDFGIGYSSLGYLKSMPINILKIDQSFVNHITDDENPKAICHAIVSMANSLHIDVIAEGVETIEQMMILRNMNCRKVQGYLISRPAPVRDFERFLKRDWRFTAYHARMHAW